MPKSRKGKKQQGRGRNRNRGNGNRQLLELKLANMDYAWDVTVSAEALKQGVSSAVMKLPPLNMSQADSGTQAMVQHMTAQGLSPNDAVEIVDMLRGTGKVIPWLNIGDPDDFSENNQEQQLMKSYGYNDRHKAIVALRKKVSADYAKEAKRLSKGFPGFG